MLTKFLDEVRTDGNVRVVSNQDAHVLSQITLAPVVTTSYQVGVLLQDKSSGKNWMIEIDTNTDEIEAFILSLNHALSIAKETHHKFHEIIKENT